MSRQLSILLPVLIALCVSAWFTQFNTSRSQASAQVVVESTSTVESQKSLRVWADLDWEFRVAITADPALIQGNENFVDFPLLVMLDGASYASVFTGAKPDGSDLLFTAGDGVTILEREIVSYDPIAQTAQIWVRMQSFSDVANELFMYYGNAAASLPAAPPTAWSDLYRAVYHFDGDPAAGVLTDSSPAGADAVLDPAALWTSADTTVARIGSGWTFNGSTHHIATNNFGTQDSSWCLSAWLLHTAERTNFMIASNPGFWGIFSQTSNTSNQPSYQWSGAGVRYPPNPLALNDGYHHFQFVFDAEADTAYFYFDGDPQPIQFTIPFGVNPIWDGLPINPEGNFTIGILSPIFASVVGDYHVGGGDEFRLRNRVVSADWVKTEYNNAIDPSSFLSFGSEENSSMTPVGPVARSLSSLRQNYPNPIGASTSIQFSNAKPGRVDLDVYDVAGRRIRRLLSRDFPAGSFQIQWDGKNGRGRRAASGVYYLRLLTQTGSTSIKMIVAP